LTTLAANANISITKFDFCQFSNMDRQLNGVKVSVTENMTGFITMLFRMNRTFNKCMLLA